MTACSPGCRWSEMRGEKGSTPCGVAAHRHRPLASENLCAGSSWIRLASGHLQDSEPCKTPVEK